MWPARVRRELGQQRPEPSQFFDSRHFSSRHRRPAKAKKQSDSHEPSSPPEFYQRTIYSGDHRCHVRRRGSPNGARRGAVPGLRVRRCRRRLRRGPQGLRELAADNAGGTAEAPAPARRRPGGQCRPSRRGSASQHRSARRDDPGGGSHDRGLSAAVLRRSRRLQSGVAWASTPRV